VTAPGVVPVSSIPRTTAVRAKAWIFDQLVAQFAGDQEMTVFWDQPDASIPTQNIVVLHRIIGRTTTHSRMMGNAGPGSFLEAYNIEIAVDCYTGGDSDVTRDLEAVAWDYACTVEAVVRSDPSLGGLVIQAFPATSDDDPEWDQEHKGRLVHIAMTIAVEAQI
jgi:hypothetical protein